MPNLDDTRRSKVIDNIAKCPALELLMKSTKEAPPFLVEQKKDESEARAVARVAISPSLQAAAAIKNYGKSIGELEIPALIDELRYQVELDYPEFHRQRRASK